MSSARNLWTPDRLALLRRLYLDQQLAPATIAKRMQLKVRQVRRKASTLGLPALRDEALIAARRRERDDAAAAGQKRAREARGEFVWTNARIAELTRLYVEMDMASAVIAERFGIAARAVRRKVCSLGLAKFRAAKGVRRQRVRRLPESPKVIRLPVGHAAGISGWEQKLKTAPPPLAADPRAVAARQRAGRRTNLYFAAQGLGK